jgi:hypothetical protein
MAYEGMCPCQGEEEQRPEKKWQGRSQELGVYRSIEEAVLAAKIWIDAHYISWSS